MLSTSGGAGGAQASPTTLASMEAPLQILWRKKKEGENFEEEEEGMRGGRRKGEPPLALDPGSAKPYRIRHWFHVHAQINIPLQILQ